MVEHRNNNVKKFIYFFLSTNKKFVIMFSYSINKKFIHIPLFQLHNKKFIMMIKKVHKILDHCIPPEQNPDQTFG